jgi:hypothetical protein
MRSTGAITIASTNGHSLSFPFLIITTTKATHWNTHDWGCLIALMELSFSQGQKSRNLGADNRT